MVSVWHKTRRSPFVVCWTLIIVSLLFGILQNADLVVGHARMECPPPLSGATGAKRGPCDSLDDGSIPPFPLKANSLNTITWLESISHPGAPARFALSDEVVIGTSSESFERCILLDHVPHDVLSRPNRLDVSTFHRSSITLWIPDIYCERCHLQLISVMSDRQHGVPADTHCIYKGAFDDENNNNRTIDYPVCPAVYHSCAPVSINGTVPRSEIDQCQTEELEDRLEWPFTPESNSHLYSRSVYYNRGDVGLYSIDDSRLIEVGSPLTDATCTHALYCDPETSFESIMTIPANAPYTMLEGTCANVVGTTPVAFSPQGYLPFASESQQDSVLDNEKSTESDEATSSATQIGYHTGFVLFGIIVLF